MQQRLAVTVNYTSSVQHITNTTEPASLSALVFILLLIRHGAPISGIAVDRGARRLTRLHNTTLVTPGSGRPTPVATLRMTSFILRLLSVR